MPQPKKTPKRKRRTLSDTADNTTKARDLLTILEKVTKEEGVIEQPLYIENVIKCRWCGNLFKGSAELKCINQHTKHAASHIQERQNILGMSNEDQTPSRTASSSKRSTLPPDRSANTSSVSLGTTKCQGLYDKCCKQASLLHRVSR